MACLPTVCLILEELQAFNRSYCKSFPQRRRPPSQKILLQSYKPNVVALNELSDIEAIGRLH